MTPGPASLMVTELPRNSPTPIAPPIDLPSDEALAAAGAHRLLPALVQMERALGDARGATEPFAGTPGAHEAYSSLDASSAGGLFLTPAFSISDTADLAFAMKGGLAAFLCYLLANGLAWRGIDTSIWTALIVAQSSVIARQSPSRSRWHSTPNVMSIVPSRIQTC